MGYYLNGGLLRAQDKADTLIKDYGAMEITLDDYPKDVIASANEGYAIVVVVENGSFDAAALAYSDAEFKEFLACNRPFRVLMMDTFTAYEMARYNG